MLKWFNKKKKDNKGFTLVELVIVVAILAILVGVLAPQYTKYVERSRQAADAANLDSLTTAVKVAAADGQYSIGPTGSNETIVYTFVMDSSSAKLFTDTAGETTGDTSDIEKALKEYAGAAWRQTTLKSSTWEAGATLAPSGYTAPSTGNTTYICAKCTIKKDGSITVEYAPADVKNSVKEK